VQVRPGANCSQALREFAQRGDESAKRVLQAFDWILSGVVRSIRCEFFEPLPQARWFDLTISKLRDGAGLIITSIDVTTRQCATGARIDLNLPLLAIRTSAGSALRKLSDTPHHRPVRGHVISIANAAARAQELLQRMRRLLNGAPLAQTEVHANRLVQDVLALVDGIARKHNVRIDYALDHHNPSVFGDALQLREMLIALVLSAIDVTASGNPEQRSVHVTTTRTPNTVEICVKHHCPESFGVGISMPIVRAIVEAHGGSLATHRLGDHGLSTQITLRLGRPRSNRFDLGPALS
jgi:C4-dicarboxylate-specific signal transduction histidine kinase